MQSPQEDRNVTLALQCWGLEVEARTHMNLLFMQQGKHAARFLETRQGMQLGVR